MEQGECWSQWTHESSCSGSSFLEIMTNVCKCIKDKLGYYYVCFVTALNCQKDGVFRREQYVVNLRSNYLEKWSEKIFDDCTNGLLEISQQLIIKS